MTDSPIFDALLDERWESLPPRTVTRWIVDRVIATGPLRFDLTRGFVTRQEMRERMFEPLISGLTYDGLQNLKGAL